MGVEVTQRNATRNQSTADFEQKKIFLFDNRFSQGVLENDDEASQTYVAGMPVVRLANGNLSAVFASGGYGTIIGVLAIDGSVELGAGETLNVSYCDKGTVNGNALDLSLSPYANLDTIFGGLSLKDVLQNLGLHVDTSIVEMTDFDN